MFLEINLMKCLYPILFCFCCWNCCHCPLETLVCVLVYVHTVHVWLCVLVSRYLREIEEMNMCYQKRQEWERWLPLQSVPPESRAYHESSQNASFAPHLWANGISFDWMYFTCVWMLSPSISDQNQIHPLRYLIYLKVFMFGAVQLGLWYWVS